MTRFSIACISKSAALVAFQLAWLGSVSPFEIVFPAQQNSAAAAPADSGVHWSVSAVVRPAIPGSDTPWGRNPVDAFVAAGCQDSNLTPNPEADPQQLVRRLYYDLTGLPPSPDQVAAFLSDRRPDAYLQLVDQLLASPAHGEKWGRHWLDLVRFAETNSYERDGVKPNAYRYRDYVIAAFNAGKPYDQFVREQIAGDELDVVTAESITATGYYRLGIWDDEPVDAKQALYDDLDDILATTSQVFLGLTLNCARCHDHKLDPIPQKDYYRFLAFFSGLHRLGGPNRGRDLQKYALREVAVDDDDPAYLDQLALRGKELAHLERELAKLDEKYAGQLPPGARDDFAFEESRVEVLKTYVGEILTEKQFQKYTALREQYHAKLTTPPAGNVKTLSVTEVGPEPRPTYVLHRGNVHAPGEEVEPGFPEVLGFDAPVIRAAAHANTSGRRRALAEWLVVENNPLTARVFVNRVWQQYFSQGLVRTPSDFGWQGEPPTHPELLDWLAAEFMANSWDIKWLHRAIVNSATYRMSSAGRAGPLAVDPTNRRLWRHEARRLSAEEVRDSVLAVSGSLNRQMHGPSIYPLIPAAVKAGQSRPGEGWHDSPPPQRSRRSVYVFIKRSLQLPLLQSFDGPDTDFSCPSRTISLQPTQALELINGTFAQREAHTLAESLDRAAYGDLRRQIALALSRVTQREPTAREIQRGIELVEKLETEAHMSRRDALAAFCVAAVSLNEFMFID